MGNPLVRSSDRTESAVTLLLLGLWLLALPVGLVAGSVWWQNLSMTVAEEQGDRFRTSATTVADAPAFVITQRGIPLTDQVPVQARWVDTAGSTRTGTVLTTASLPAGTEQTVWIDADGRLVDPPMTASSAAILVVFCTTGAWLCWGGLLYGARSALRYRLNRQRMADWAAEWLQVEPVWSGRFRTP
jgi:hypothetical protein